MDGRPIVVNIPKITWQLASTEYNSEKADALVTDRVSAEKFANEAVARYELSINLMTQALTNLDANKPKDRVNSGILLKAIVSMRADVGVDLLIKFLDVIDPEFQELKAPEPKEGQSKTDKETDDAIKFLQARQTMSMKYPAKSLLVQKGTDAVNALKKVVLNEAHDSLRVRLAIHTLESLLTPRKVSSWLRSEPLLKEKREQRSKLLTLTEEIRRKYFPARRKW